MPDDDEFPDLVNVGTVVTREQILRLYEQYTAEFARYLRALGVDTVWT